MGVGATPWGLPLGASQAEVLVHVHRYQRALEVLPLLSTARLLSYYSLLWLAGVVAIGLKIVEGGQP